MKKLIVYFHGYGSSPESDKVTRLSKEKGFEVRAFPINLDPDVAYKELSADINLLLATDPEVPCKLVFVGTSLGGWWANRLAIEYGCDAAVINPSVNPQTSLQKYGVSEVICQKYFPMIPNKKHKYFFAERDEVIDNTLFYETLYRNGFNIGVVKNADHRFGGIPFENVVNYLRNL